MIDTLSENCFSSGFKFMSHSGVIMPHVKVDQAISLHTTPSFFSPSTGEGEYLPFFFPFLIISLPTESAAPVAPTTAAAFSISEDNQGAGRGRLVPKVCSGAPG